MDGQANSENLTTESYGSKIIRGPGLWEPPCESR